jgi:hypothetical protein
MVYSNMQEDGKLASYWEIFLIVHKYTLLQQVYTYMLIYLLGLHNTSILLLAHCLGFFGFTPTMPGGSDLRMDDQAFKHSTTHSSLSIFFSKPNIDYKYSDTGSRAVGYISSADAFKILLTRN